MRKQLKNRIKNRQGFSLAETLLAVMILLMVSAVVAAGIPAAKNAYENVVLASNAEVLLSTAVSSLRNELGMAQDVKSSDAKTLTYYNAARGSSSKLYVGSASSGAAGGSDDEEDAPSAVQQILLQRYYSEDGMSKDYPAAPLVSAKTATQDLYVTYESVAFNNGIVTFSGLSVDRESGAEGLASRPSLSIRVFSESEP